MDMHHWLTDRVRQKQFDVYWRPGRENLADKHTKHHSAQHHKDMRHLILHEANSLQVLQGYVKLLPLLVLLIMTLQKLWDSSSNLVLY
jgi:hypothetical protein